MKAHVITSVRITLVLLVLLCGIYPALVWGIGQLAFRDAANGSLVVRNGKVVGSWLIGQSFTSPHYFHSRPSAAGGGYNAMLSGGSNLGPTSQTLNDRLAASVAGWKDERPTTGIPADAVTASGSGLDPHISPENARGQAARVARARGIALGDVNRIIDENVEGRFVGIYGEPRVNVLALNMALDALKR